MRDAITGDDATDAVDYRCGATKLGRVEGRAHTRSASGSADDDSALNDRGQDGRVAWPGAGCSAGRDRVERRDMAAGCEVLGQVLAMLKVVSAPRVISSCLPISTISITCRVRVEVGPCCRPLAADVPVFIASRRRPGQRGGRWCRRRSSRPASALLLLADQAICPSGLASAGRRRRLAANARASAVVPCITVLMPCPALEALLHPG